MNNEQWILQKSQNVTNHSRVAQYAVTRFIYCSLFIANCSLSYGQSATPEAEQRYKAAVKLVQLGDYESAKRELLPMTDRNNSFAPYAHYYYAIAAFRQRNYGQARPMLKQLADRYPDWRKRDDASYIMAAINMETGQYEDALKYIETIGDPDLKADVDKLERFFFLKITDLTRMKSLQKEFPTNRNLGLALIDLIQRSSSDRADLELSDQLTNRFGAPVTADTRTAPPRATAPVSQANNKPASPTAPATHRAKGYYNVAVLYPFRVEEAETGTGSRGTQYVYDLFAGMRLAQSKLQDEGVTVNLFAYDLDNDDDKTLSLINNTQFGQSDLIFGPLYAEPNKLVTSFAGLNSIPLVNPIATSSDLVTGQPMAFLAQPSLAVQADKTLEFMHGLNVSKKVAVYFGTARKDSLLAAVYQAKLKQKGFQVIDFQKLGGPAEARSGVMKISDINLPGHVFFVSSNEDDGSRMIDALNKLNVNAPLVASAGAFDFYKNSISTFTRRELYLLWPEFTDSSLSATADFERAYLDRENIIPSVFARQGYDMLLFFGRQLAKNGINPQNRALLRSDTDDYTLSGFDYTKSNENQLVPIVKYDGGRFVKVN
jgi:ABC-type branched-subunit amino acid transport system substrate-binding protein